MGHPRQRVLRNTKGPATLSDNRDPPVPANAPAPDALFALSRRGYARSDKRGMIECANTLPSPANSLDRTALLGTPQKILHHPNMPRGLIHLIWQTLERDQPVGAYICDHSHTGERFWVFAVFLPIKDGYLSVQLSPSSAGWNRLGRCIAICSRLSGIMGLRPPRAPQIWLLGCAKPATPITAASWPQG